MGHRKELVKVQRGRVREIEVNQWCVASKPREQGREAEDRQQGQGLGEKLLGAVEI